MAHLGDGGDLIEVLYRKDAELARAITLRHLRVIRRLRDRLAEFISPEELRAILGEDDLELLAGARPTSERGDGTHHER
jgi:hypothetical protein